MSQHLGDTCLVSAIITQQQSDTFRLGPAPSFWVERVSIRDIYNYSLPSPTPRLFHLAHSLRTQFPKSLPTPPRNFRQSVLTPSVFCAHSTLKYPQLCLLHTALCGFCSSTRLWATWAKSMSYPGSPLLSHIIEGKRMGGQFVNSFFLCWA